MCLILVAESGDNPQPIRPQTLATNIKDSYEALLQKETGFSSFQVTL